MNAINGIILCLAYLLGLLSTNIFGGGYWVLAAGVILAAIVPRFWRTGVNSRVWLIAGVVGMMASIYLQMRTPQPASNNISQLVTEPAQVVAVEGKITRSPRLTRSGRSQFILSATQLGDKAVTGQLYTTVPLLQSTGLHPGQKVTVTGRLYHPKPAANPGAFDFQAYLKREGIFAGLSGHTVTINADSGNWGWWKVQQKIVRSFVRGLDIPAGPLVSSMVIGSRAIDLPFDVRDSFIQVGLAHALAASGFQVSLLLGWVLALTRRFSKQVQFSVGVGTLIIFVGLTGLQPSVMRAALMGFGVLLALILERKVKPLGLLLVTAVLLLVFNPLWIQDLGFQLSFLATLGLVVTVDAIAKRLDWLPPAIASLISVPLAASLWTLPLLLYSFGIVSPYSILVNIIASPIISLITIGGVISALAALIWLPAGSALALLLYYPTWGLIHLVQFFAQLPGNTVAVGTISTIQLLILYGIISLVWLQSLQVKIKPIAKEKKQPKKIKSVPWQVAALVAIAVVIIPIWQTQSKLVQVTVLAAPEDPIFVIQDRGKVTLINSGDETTAGFTVLPFLQKQGINQIDWAIATNQTRENRSGWFQVLDRLSVKNFYDVGTTGTGENLEEKVKADRGTYQVLPLGQLISLGTNSVQIFDADAQAVNLKIGDRTWLLLGNNANALQLPQASVLWGTGNNFNPDILKKVRPETAIFSSATLEPNTAQYLKQNQIQLYNTNLDGAVVWTPVKGFETTLDLEGDRADL